MITIKIKTFGDMKMPLIISKGDWIDLRANESMIFSEPKYTKKDGLKLDSKLIPLGVAMKLPEGYEAILVPRSSTFKKTGLLQTNSIGVIDSTYCGDNDEWKFPVVATKDVLISEGMKICQFRIQLSQKATFWQKLKWLFSSSINIINVDSLQEEDRGGFGSTGGY
jgi:dUTP pyrophosphatase